MFLFCTHGPKEEEPGVEVGPPCLKEYSVILTTSFYGMNQMI